MSSRKPYQELRKEPTPELRAAQDALLKGFDDGDVKAWEEWLGKKTTGQLIRQKSSEFRDELFRKITSYFQALESSQPALEVTNRLSATIDILRSLLKTKATADTRLSISIEGAQVALQKRDP